jgi:hypothetical protein
VSNCSQCMTGIFTANQVPLVSPTVIIMFTIVTLVFSSLEATIEYYDEEERHLG